VIQALYAKFSGRHLIVETLCHQCSSFVSRVFALLRLLMLQMFFKMDVVFLDNSQPDPQATVSWHGSPRIIHVESCLRLKSWFSLRWLGYLQCDRYLHATEC